MPIPPAKRRQSKPSAPCRTDTLPDVIHGLPELPPEGGRRQAVKLGGAFLAGQRRLKILWKMWQTHTAYNEALHLQNQTRYGPWILKLTTT